MMINREPDQCRDESRENIPWYVNGTLSGTAALAVREHLKGCSDCQADFELHTAMRAQVLGREVMPIIPATRSDDLFEVGRDGGARRSHDRRVPLQWIAVAASIGFLGVALIASYNSGERAREANQLFETATSAGSSGGIDYVLRLTFEDGVSHQERVKIAEQLDGAVKWTVNDDGDYEVHVQLATPSLEALQEYERHTDALAGVQSAKFTALQLPMR